ncbi:MAG: hypothetical protein HY074_16120 [Deltaproteobacteria bacterium]|nr:hypothetical protein [Deltaproteobacteria bacterium]
MRKILEITRTAFPLLGEANSYEPSTTKTTAAFMNRFLLERDPKLAIKLGGAENKTPGNVAAAFLLRALDSDAGNLKNYPMSRREKWNRHLSAVGLQHLDFADPARIQDNIYNAVAEAVTGSPSSADARQTAVVLKKYFAAPYETQRNGFFGQQNELHFLLPHRYCYLPGVSPPQKEWQREVVLAQLAWEISGLLSQYLLFSNGFALLEHVDNLTKFAQAVTGNPLLEDGFRVLREKIQELVFA